LSTEGTGLVSARVLIPLSQAAVLSFPTEALAVAVALARVASATAGASWWEIVESIVGAERVSAADGSKVSTVPPTVVEEVTTFEGVLASE